MNYKLIELKDVSDLAKMYIDTFNSPPWNDKWTIATASKRLQQMINCESFYGLMAYENEILCGLILGSEEQFYDCVMFSIREFCVCNELRGQGIGTEIFHEFESRLKEKGVSQIILLTSREDGTQGFYQKRGLSTYDGMVVMGKQL